MRFEILCSLNMVSSDSDMGVSMRTDGQMGGWVYSNEMNITETECFIEGRPEPNSAGTDFNHRQRLKHLNVEEGWTDREHLDIYLHQRTIRVVVCVCVLPL